MKMLFFVSVTLYYNHFIFIHSLRIIRKSPNAITLAL